MVERIISGGQTGVDRAALDYAIAAGIPHGGWVPKGRRAEDGVVPAKYQVREHALSSYPPRTEANVKEADATVIFVTGLLTDERGCLLTATLCRENQKPYAVISLVREEKEGVERLRTFLELHRPKVLNVAGARGSRGPDTAKLKRILAGSITAEP